MDKTMSEGDRMQDEEIYALLDKAMNQDRLCVSEELIQKTLCRIKEESSTTVVPMRKTKKKLYHGMQYACVAAAAAVVLFVGSKVLDAGFFSAKKNAEYNIQEEITGRSGVNLLGDDSGDRETKDMAENRFNEADTSQKAPNAESVGCADEDEAVVTDGRSDSYMRAELVSLPSELQEVLKETGYAPVEAEAECWEYVQQKDDRRQEIVQALGQTESVPGILPDAGNYRYPLMCADGSTKTLWSEEPLTQIIRIDTEQGILWCLEGNGICIYLEPSDK